MIAARLAVILVDVMDTEPDGLAPAKRTPGDGPTAPHRQRVFRGLRERNERRARVAKLNGGRSQRDPWIENAQEVQSDHRHRLP